MSQNLINFIYMKLRPSMKNKFGTWIKNVKAHTQTLKPLKQGKIGGMGSRLYLLLSDKNI